VKPETSTHNPLVRLLAVNLAGGIVAAMVAVAGLIALDSFGLRRLMLVDRHPVVVGALLLFAFVVTLGSLAMGSAIMMLSRPGDDSSA